MSDALPGDQHDAASTAAYDAAKGPFHDVRLHVANIASRIHHQNRRWWVDLHTGAPIERNVGEMLMLTVSELAEAMEGHRKNLRDDKLPHRPMLEVELADALIRVCDMAAGLGLDLAGAVAEKLEFNAHRIDHTREARLGEHGKKY